jgi:hypothetical protein
MLYEATAPSYDRVSPFGYMFGGETQWRIEACTPNDAIEISIIG